MEVLLFQNPILWTATRTNKHVSFQKNDQMICGEIDTYHTVGLKILGAFTCNSSQQHPQGLLGGLKKVVMIGSAVHLTSTISPNSTTMLEIIWDIYTIQSYKQKGSIIFLLKCDWLM